MHECLKNIHWGKVILSALAYLIISAITQKISLMVTANYFLMPEYLGVWNKAMMPELGLPPLQFTLTSLGYSLVSGFALATLYAYVKDSFEKCFCSQVSGYTLMVSIFSLVFTFLPMLMMFNLPFLLVMAWFITSIVTVFFSSMVFAKLIK